MITPRIIYISFIFLLLFSSCKNSNRNTYAIKDFRKSLQRSLTKIITNGVVTFDSSIKYNATDEELKDLSNSEHPILRAMALREMLIRPAFDHFNIIMNHLDDTALVSVDEGEFGYEYKMLSDDLIQHAKWKDTISKNKTIEAIITKHNYLEEAYIILKRIEPQEKYYSYIKEMVERSRPYKEIEYALYGLAGFKKSEDIKTIKQSLLNNLWRINDVSFELMRKFPNDEYMEVLERYYPKRFYSSYCTDGYYHSDGIQFINTVASYKNKRSAKILDSILHKKPFLPCKTNVESIKQTLAYAIWDNSCDSYLKLRSEIEDIVKNAEKYRDKIPPIQIELPADTAAEPVRWW